MPFTRRRGSSRTRSAGSRKRHYGKDPSLWLGHGLWRPGRGVRGTPPRSGTAGGREVECPGQGRDNRSIIKTVVETQLQAGYTVSPFGACFTSPFFLLAALLDPEKSHLAKKSERNTNVTGFTVVSENCVKGCEAIGCDTATGSPENDFRYVGEQLDPNSGFYYNRARWMDPGTGRFIGVDPYEGDPQSPVSLHRYLYANASPVSFADPTGQFSFTLTGVMAAMTISGTLAGAAYTYFHPPGSDPEKNFTWKGYLTWTAAGALTAGAAISGTWVFAGASLPLIEAEVRQGTQVIGTISGRISPSVSNYWTSAQSALGHYGKHAGSLKSFMGTNLYTPTQYAADAAFIVQNYSGPALKSTTGLNAAVSFLGRNAKGLEVFGLVLSNQGGKVVTFFAVTWKDLVKQVPQLGRQ